MILLYKIEQHDLLAAHDFERFSHWQFEYIAIMFEKIKFKYYREFANVLANKVILPLNIFNSSIRDIMAETTDPDIQVHLAKDDCEHVRITLARNSALCEKAQLILSKDNLWSVRAELAANEFIFDETQMLLANDEKHFVKQSLVENKSICEAAQVTLACDRIDVKHCLAENKSICEAAQVILAQDLADCIRLSVARNTALCEKAMSILEKDNHPEVRKLVRSQKDLV